MAIQSGTLFGGRRSTGDEPVLRGLAYVGILNQTCFEDALSYILAQGLGNAEAPVMLLRQLFDCVLAVDARIGAAARADLIAVRERMVSTRDANEGVERTLVQRRERLCKIAARCRLVARLKLRTGIDVGPHHKSLEDAASAGDPHRFGYPSVFATHRLFVGHELVRGTGKDCKIHVQKERTVACRTSVEVARHDVIGARADHRHDAVQLLPGRDSRQTLLGEIRASLLIVVAMGVIDRVVKPDRSFDGCRIGQERDVLAREVQHPLDVAKIVVMPVGTRIGLKELSANAWQYQCHQRAESQRNILKTKISGPRERKVGILLG
jgi:hypothetical protein